MKSQIELAQQDTQSIVEELLNDGSDPDALYLIEHHISSTDFDTLEKVAIEAFKLGYEATDPEELHENNQLIITFDIVSEIPLDADLINSQIAQIIELTNKFAVSYDGWGTYFEGDDEDGEYDENEFDEEEDNENTLH